MAKKKSKRKYTKNCKAGITPSMWILMQELKIKTGKSKAAIIREAIEDFAQKEGVI